MDEEGIVIKSTGSWYVVQSFKNKKITCRLRGKLRLTKSKETNPVTVGDHVEIQENKGEYVISHIKERKNHLVRKSVKKTGHTHVLAANVDQLLILATWSHPRTSTGFIDRLIATAEAFDIQQLIIFNKSDILSIKDQREVQKLQDLYTSLGVSNYCLSALQDTDTSLQPIRTLFWNKITLVAGHSGVGKTTLLNRLAQDDHSKSIQSLSSHTHKGVHTTTHTEMVHLTKNTFFIDTPGIKEWGVINMDDQEISDYFVEMRDIRKHCKYGSRCVHHHEPNCAVRDAVQDGHIAMSRYTSYLRILTGEDNRK